MGFLAQNEIFRERLRRALPGLLPAFLQNKRWFAGKAETLRSIRITESIAFEAAAIDAFLFLVRIDYSSGNAEEYALPLRVVPLSRDFESSRFLVVEAQGEFPGCILADALEDKVFAQFILESIEEGNSVKGEQFELVTASTPALHRLMGASADALEPSVMRAEQSNTSINYGGKLILKFFRRVQEGVSLDLETGIFLTEKAHFEHTPSLAGYLEYRRTERPPVTLAILQGFVRNRGDAWKYTLEALDEYLGRMNAFPNPPAGDRMPRESLLGLAERPIPAFAREVIGAYLTSAALLGRRTAELHLALSSDAADPHFAPQPFSLRERKSLSDSIEGLIAKAVRLLKERMEFLTLLAQEKARRVLSLEGEILSRIQQVTALEDAGQCTRVHGDYHLGQVLYTGADFVIIDFEGEPERPLAERRAKRSPLRDVAGMLRSFHYAASSALLRRHSEPNSAGSNATPELWARYWRCWVSVEFLRSYLETARKAIFMPQGREQLRVLLEIFLLEKAVYEIIYELKNRPTWVTIPLDGILDLL